jgi:polyisoprenoid-binding protein YceI
MRRGLPCVMTALGLSLGLSFAHAGAACQLPSPPDPAKPAALYQVVTGPSWVRFDAKAFLHDFAGKTSHIEGAIRVGDANRLPDAEACVRIDAASLDTGNSTRDGIMRNDHLETARFPTIDFLLQAVDGVTHQGETREFTAKGTLSLHGVRREIQFPVRARREGDAVLLAGQLPLKMTDYGIQIPRFLLLTVDDQVTVSFDVTARPAQP